MKTAIIGAGTMGRGIAQAAALAGHTVALTDSDAAQRDGALTAIRATLDGGVARGKVTAADRDAALGRISLAPAIAAAAHGADVAIEAVPERMALKRSVFAELDWAAPTEALLASNTSSLSITEIAHASDRPGRVLGMHFFNPVHQMRLVEVVRGERTADDAVARAIAFAESLGKTAIEVRDTPGFATSRLGVVLGLEAIRMVEQGVASAEDIDRAMELGYNHPMGPLKLGDLVGLDVRLAIADHLYEAFAADTYRAPELLRRMVADGKLGKKTGEGFYKWPPA